MTKKKIKVEATTERKQVHMKIVTTETCLACKQPCQRGMDYVDRMSQPGAIGYGVPCILSIQQSEAARTRK